MVTRLEIVDAGLRTTVQDAGRCGWEHLGVPRGGALDFAAYRWANRLAANRADLAALECLLAGVTVRPDTDVWAGVTGARQVRIDGRSVPAWSGFRVPGETSLEIQALDGARCYVAFQGGIAVPPVLGSRSTYLPAALGGFEGRPLRSGDLLPLGRAGPMPQVEILRAPTRAITSPLQTRFAPGLRRDRLPEEALSILLSQPFTVSPQSNEMGLRLLGPPLPPGAGTMLSEPMPVGGIQITPGGHAIVLLNARGTIGGYPVLGTVITPDTWRLGQARPGDPISFAAVSVEEARRVTVDALQDLEAATPAALPICGKPGKT